MDNLRPCFSRYFVENMTFCQHSTCSQLISCPCDTAMNVPCTFFLFLSRFQPVFPVVHERHLNFHTISNRSSHFHSSSSAKINFKSTSCASHIVFVAFRCHFVHLTQWKCETVLPDDISIYLKRQKHARWKTCGSLKRRFESLGTSQGLRRLWAVWSLTGLTVSGAVKTLNFILCIPNTLVELQI